MPKASPARVSFNAGEWSPLMYGRIDHEKYQYGCRKLENYISVAQGPAIARSGTSYKQRTFQQNKYSHLIPFIFSEDQSLMLEFSDAVMRIHTDDGVLTHGDENVAEVMQANPLIIRAPQFVSAVSPTTDDYAILSGFPAASRVNGRIARITAVAGDNITFGNITNYIGNIGVLPGTQKAAKVFQLETPYSDVHVRNLRHVQDMDVMYLFCKQGSNAVGYKPQKLSRIGSLEWTMEDIDFKDGPYLPEEGKQIARLTPSDTGQATVDHGANTVAGSTGGTASSATGTPWNAFDRDPDSYWEGADQSGTLQYEFNTARTIKGYILYNYVPAPTGASNVTPVDRRPLSWIVEGSQNGSAWTILDEQRSYALWNNHRTQFIDMRNYTAYLFYRIRILALESGGQFKPEIQEWALFEQEAPTLTLTASSVLGINKDKGFKSSDVGRYIRLYQGDGHWHVVKITAWTSTTVVTVQPVGQPLYGTRPVTRWRMGAFSTSTGFPTMASWGYDRLWMSGVRDFPTELYGSQPTNYDQMNPSDETGAVLDGSGFTLRPKTRNAAPAGFMAFTGRGMAVGYGSGEWVISPATDSAAFSARNAKAMPATKRGAAFVDCVQVDNETIYVTKDKRTLREFAYVFQADGYKAPSMSTFASHLGAPKFAQIEFQQNPHSIIWCRMENDTLVGFTYDREQNVLSWHTHPLGKGTGVARIESIAVKPNDAGTMDELWIVVDRDIPNIDGVNRYIEKLEPFWQEGDNVNDAFYVDSGLAANFAEATETVYGLDHLEGQSVVGLADGIAFGYETLVVVENGAITLPNGPASKIRVGLDFQAFGETLDIEAGAGDGTAQGKTKRLHNISMRVWETSVSGEFGVFDQMYNTYYWTPVSQQQDLGAEQLVTRVLEPIIPEGVNDVRGSIAFRRVRPYPMNVVGIYPQLHTQDR